MWHTRTRARCRLQSQGAISGSNGKSGAARPPGSTCAPRLHRSTTRGTPAAIPRFACTASGTRRCPPAARLVQAPASCASPSGPPAASHAPCGITATGPSNPASRHLLRDNAAVHDHARARSRAPAAASARRRSPARSQARARAGKRQRRLAAVICHSRTYPSQSPRRIVISAMQVVQVGLVQHHHARDAAAPPHRPRCGRRCSPTGTAPCSPRGGAVELAFPHRIMSPPPSAR